MFLLAEKVISSESETLVPRPKYKEEDFPPPGTVFVAPVADGRLAAGRVLQRAFTGGAQAALVAATPWIGTDIPPLESSVLRETLILTHHSWKSKPEIFWTWDLMPEDFRIVGQIELPESDRTAPSASFTGWQAVPLQALMQWRWDHDREALLRDEADEAARLAELNRKRAAVREEYLRTLMLDALAEPIRSKGFDYSPSSKVSNIPWISSSVASSLTSVGAGGVDHDSTFSACLSSYSTRSSCAFCSRSIS